MTQAIAAPSSAPRVSSKRTLTWRTFQVFCRVTTSLMFDLKVYGKENIPPNGGIILAANHQSYLDPVLVAVQLTRPVSFLARASLFKNKAFAAFIRDLNAFPIEQGKGDRGAINETIERLKEGHMLNLYPEGTRTQDGELQPLQPGIGLVARRAGVPVVPVAIQGSFKAWPKGQTIPKPAKIRVKYGKPIDVSGMKADQILKTIDASWRQLIADLRAMENP